ncbi:DUF1993 domain-containing protein [Roseobacter sinensis]|uniref:DUF1993 domain-containing protein n=1 Tax=Roseobacter sinensis TaxID=2931391 RepID=A0ABT3BCN6_9RHOB|nr:DUF1993 domain-containing protein [Roseobacter sp. WL0113]MCV3271342.1 DUF1993 domain-containing protein [Roseobacter sp. WL0113]
MPADFAAPALRTLQHYLDRCVHLLQRIGGAANPEDMLSTQLAPDSFDTGTHLAIAIQFAARAAGPPAGVHVPEIPDVLSVPSLLAYQRDIAALVGRITPDQLCYVVSHTAGDASLTQEPDDYVLRFALPNMIFHMSMAYAALRVAGLDLGKADFDGLHEY